MRYIYSFTKAFITLALAITGSMNVSAHDFEVDGIYYKRLDNTEKIVAVTYKGDIDYEHNEYIGDVIIPETVNYNNTIYTVRNIDNAFSFCTELTSVSIPNSIKIINGGFRACTNLTSITIPNSVIIIGGTTFRDCTNLTNVTIGDSVFHIGVQTFKGCTSLTEITIPKSVTGIGIEAFHGCTNLNTVYFNAKECSIAGGPESPVFKGCTALTNIILGNEVKTIPDYAFLGCSSLKTITIGDSISSIGVDAFFGCENLSEVNISNLSSWCSIDFDNSNENPLFYSGKLKLNDSEITNLVIPDNVTAIKQYAFYNCNALNSVTIPNSVNLIGRYAFSNCSELTNVSIGESVSEIGSFAFYSCKLELITSYCTTPPGCGFRAFYDSYSASLIVPEGTSVAYSNASEWSKFTNTQTKVDHINTNKDIEVARYDIYGRLLIEPTNGINIVKYSDGSTRKLIIKKVND